MSVSVITSNLFCVYFWPGKPRVGVLNVEGKALGFIFIDTTSSLTLLRHAIDEQVTVLMLVFDSCFASEVGVF